MVYQQPNHVPASRARLFLHMGSKISLIAIIAALAFGLITLVVFYFAEAEYKRELASWEVRLGLVADNQHTALSNWINKQFTALEDLADNPSLQLYMTELSLGNEDGQTQGGEEPPERSYLRNLLTLAASRNNFVSEKLQPKVEANVRPTGNAGIALIDMEGRPLVATSNMPPLDRKLAEFIKTLRPGQRNLLNIYIGQGNKKIMAFAVPVFAIQGEKIPEQQIGVVIGVKPIENELFSLILPPLVAGSKTLESLLLQKEMELVRFISPLQLLSQAPMPEVESQYTIAGQAGSFAFNNPGVFAIQQDYRDTMVLLTSRPITETGWVLMVKVDQDEALAESNSRRKRLVGLFVVTLLFIIACIIAAWRHGSSLKSERQAAEYKELMEEFQAQENLLRLVTDNQPDAMFIVDREHRYHFANYQAALHAGLNESDMIHKTLHSV